MNKLLIALLLISVAAPAGAEAARRKRRTTPAVKQTAPSCEQTSNAEAPVKMDEHTVYMPGKGGINGSCSGGASAHRGFPACKNTLDKYIKGQSGWVHTAAQQQGGSAVLFGCWASTKDLMAKRIPAGTGTQKNCHVLAIADRYARSENAGRPGVARTRYGSRKRGVIGAKVDIEVDSNSRFARAVSGANGGEGITCLGRLPGVTNRERKDRRDVGRDPAALLPPT